MELSLLHACGLVLAAQYKFRSVNEEKSLLLLVVDPISKIALSTIFISFPIDDLTHCKYF